MVGAMVRVWGEAVVVGVAEAHRGFIPSSMASGDGCAWARREPIGDDDGRRRFKGVGRSWEGTSVPCAEGKRTQQAPYRCGRAEGDARNRGAI
jgi:hypothetical protein